MIPAKFLDFPVPGRRIVIVGSSGSGKTTLAKTVAERLGLPHVEIDSLQWQPNWQEAGLPILRTRISEALAGPTWVVDGNYAQLRDITWARGDTLIWLELPLAIVLWRLFARTFKRIFTREILWNGNRETLRGAFFLKGQPGFVYAQNPKKAPLRIPAGATTAGILPFKINSPAHTGAGEILARNTRFSLVYLAKAIR